MYAFYLDEPLRAAEELDVLRQLKAFGHDVCGGITYKKLEKVEMRSAIDKWNPRPSKDSEKELENELEGYIKYVRQSGMLGIDTGIIFISPKDETPWALRVQMAFLEISSAPFMVVQPWQTSEEGTTTRREFARLTKFQ